MCRILLVIIFILTAIMTTATVKTPLLNPDKERLSDSKIQADLTTLKSIQARIIKLNNKGIPLTEYFLAKSQAWLDFAWDEYTENDRGSVIEEALNRSDAIIKNYEAGQKNIDMTTPLIMESIYIRSDIWSFVEKTKKNKLFKCVEDLVAKLEVQLICAGHEEKEMGWRHAKSAVMAAERLMNEIEKRLRNCKECSAVDDIIPSVETPVKSEAKLSLAIPQDIITEANDEFSVVNIGSPLIENANINDVIITNDAPTLFKIGITNVKWLAKTKTTELSAIQHIRVVDTTPPQLNIPSDIISEATGLHNKIAIGNAVAVDIADKHPLITNNMPDDFPTGITEVTWTAIDASGNKSSATQKITIKDTTVPNLKVPADLNVLSTEKKIHVDIGMATANDTCDINPVISNDAPEMFSIGNNIVYWTATDKSGNKVTGQQKINVINNSVPTIKAPVDIIHEMTDRDGTIVNIGIAVGFDNIDQTPIISNNAPKVFPIGTTNVIWIAKNTAGNTATAIQKVTLVDTTPPSLTIPENIRLMAPVKNIQLNNAIAVDIVDPNPTIVNDAPAELTAGKNIVTWTATDFSGNTAKKNQTIEVVALKANEILHDNKSESTVITLPENIHFALDKDNISKKTALKLIHIADIMKKYPEITVTLTGYTDPRGSIKHNKQLSERRADAVKTFLVENGIAKNRIKTFSTVGNKLASTDLNPYNTALERVVIIRYFLPVNATLKIVTASQEDDLQIERKK